MRQVRDTLDRWIWEMIGIVLARWPPSGNQTWHVLQLCRCSVTPFEIAIPFYALSLFTCLTVWEMGMGLKFLGPQKRMVSDFRTFQIQFGMTSHVESWYVVMASIQLRWDVEVMLVMPFLCLSISHISALVISAQYPIMSFRCLQSSVPRASMCHDSWVVTNHHKPLHETCDSTVFVVIL
jgi:hypothetical protein